MDKDISAKDARKLIKNKGWNDLMQSIKTYAMCGQSQMNYYEPLSSEHNFKLQK